MKLNSDERARIKLALWAAVSGTLSRWSAIGTIEDIAGTDELGLDEVIDGLAVGCDTASDLTEESLSAIIKEIEDKIEGG